MFITLLKQFDLSQLNKKLMKHESFTQALINGTAATPSLEIVEQAPMQLTRIVVGNISFEQTRSVENKIVPANLAPIAKTTFTSTFSK